MRSLATAIGIGMSVATLAAQGAPKLLVERELVLRTGVSRCLAWSHDGTRIASGGSRGDVFVIDATSGRIVRELDVGNQAVLALSFAPDDRTLAVTGTDDASLWKLDDARCSGRARSRALAWSPDGTMLASVEGDALVVVRRAVGMTPTGRPLVPGGQRIEHVAFAADGASIVAWREGDAAFTMNPRTDAVTALGGAALPSSRVRVVRPTENANASIVNDVKSIDGSLRASAKGQLLELRRGDTIERNLTLRHRSAPLAVALTTNGRFVAIADECGATEVFRCENGTATPLPDDVRGTPVPWGGGTELAMWHHPPRVVETFGAKPFVTRVDWQPSDRLSLWSIDAIAAGKRGHVRDIVFADAGGAGRDAEVPFAISRNGRFVVVRGGARELTHPDTVLWNLPDAPEIELAPSGDRVLVRDIVSMRPTMVLHDGDGPDVPLEAFRANWSPCGDRIATATGEKLRILDATRLDEIATLDTEELGLAWIDDEHLVSWGRRDEGDREQIRRGPPPPTPGGTSITLRRVRTLDSRTVLDVTGNVRSICVDLNSARLAVLLEDRVVLVRIDR